MGVLPSQLHAAMLQLCRRRLCHDQGLLLPPQSLAHNSATSFWFSLESCYPHQVTAVKVTMNPRCGTIVDFDLPMQSTFRSAGQGFADWPDWHNPAKSSEDWHLEIAELRLSGCAFTIASFWWNRITFLPPSSMDQDSGSRSVNDWAGIWNIPAHWKNTVKVIVDWTLYICKGTKNEGSSGWWFSSEVWNSKLQRLSCVFSMFRWSSTIHFVRVVHFAFDAVGNIVIVISTFLSHLSRSNMEVPAIKNPNPLDAPTAGLTCQDGIVRFCP